MRTLAAAVLLVVALAAGTWWLGAEVAATTNAAIALTALWFAVVGAAALVLSRGRRTQRRVLLATHLAVTAALLGVGAYTSLHETTIDERLESGRPASKVLPAEEADALLAPQGR